MIFFLGARPECHFSIQGRKRVRALKTGRQGTKGSRERENDRGEQGKVDGERIERVVKGMKSRVQRGYRLVQVEVVGCRGRLVVKERRF